jgi:hypothetical protein
MENDQKIIEWESILSIGNLRLPEKAITLNAPDRTPIGELTFQRLKDGTDRISAKINHTIALRHHPLSSLILPNGSKIMTTGPSEIPVMEIPLFENSRLYFGTDLTGTTLSGIAINLPAFDRILSMFPESGILNHIEFHHSAISGSAGIYRSKSTGNNGVFLIARRTTNSSAFESDHSPEAFTKAITKITRNPASNEPFTTASLISQIRLNYLLGRNATVRIK